MSTAATRSLLLTPLLACLIFSGSAVSGPRRPAGFHEPRAHRAWFLEPIMEQLKAENPAQARDLDDELTKTYSQQQLSPQK